MAPSQVNWLVFVSAWTLLALIYLIVVPARFSDTAAHHKFAILGVETLTMLFWFAGFVALAVFLSNRVCFGHVCAAAKAAAVFGAFEWYVFDTNCSIQKSFSLADDLVCFLFATGSSSPLRPPWPSSTSFEPAVAPATEARRIPT